MKTRQLILPALIAVTIAACSSPDGKQETADTTVKTDSPAIPADSEATSLCFLRTDGNGNRDTTSTELLIKDKTVTGQMYWHPFEKDSRKGTLAGTLKGDTVYAVWSFMQEGMQDTMALQFLIKGSDLLQKPLKLNTKSGREQTDNAAVFTVLHHPSVNLKK